MSAVTDVLDKLSNGQITTDQAAEAFTDMPWPSAAPAARSLTDIESDPDPAAREPGDWAEVEQAYVDNQITLSQYERLTAAMEGGAG